MSLYGEWDIDVWEAWKMFQNEINIEKTKTKENMYESEEKNDH